MRFFITLVFTTLFSASVFAGQCPALVGEIDQKLESSQLDDETKAEIKAMRDKGEALHQQGKHAESVKVLREATEKLDVMS
ncbi:hypothetical protein [Marinobacter sp. F4216]|uniref:hypothetical protein n=1 Tax=Marinobacter sp. F4216 TaxID=2874281 RepID=UPI001CBB6163|nr:hypothetical protein [Marinobacter sp. F4216]MBZ2170052.1 hypothetical protein [Marinobacter sp. F4216]